MTKAVKADSKNFSNGVDALGSPSEGRQAKAALCVTLRMGIVKWCCPFWGGRSLLILSDPPRAFLLVGSRSDPVVTEDNRHTGVLMSFHMCVLVASRPASLFLRPPLFASPVCSLSVVSQIQNANFMRIRVPLLYAPLFPLSLFVISPLSPSLLHLPSLLPSLHFSAC